MTLNTTFVKIDVGTYPVAKSAALHAAIINGELPISCTSYDTVTYQPYSYVEVAYVLPNAAPARSIYPVVIDFGLFRECFAYSFPIPEVNTPLSTSVCFSKVDLCDLIDAAQLSSSAASVDASETRSELNIICKKMTATAALSCLVTGFLFVFCVITIFPTAKRLLGRAAGEPVQIALLSVTACLSLCAVIVWATVDVDGRTMEQHFKEQLMSSEIGVFLSTLLPQNFRFEMGYSHGMEIATLILVCVAWLITLLGFKKVVCVSRQCCAKKTLSVRMCMTT